MDIQELIVNQQNKIIMEISNFTITKSTIESYKIRSKEFAWADINVDSSGNQGRIQIASDYGNWQNYWGACGCSFNEFLASLNIHYFAGKVGADKWFDLKKTTDFLQQRIDDSSIGVEYREKINNELNELKNKVSNEADFIYLVQNCDCIMEFENFCPELIKSVDPGFKIFWDEIWPLFINEITKVETA